MLGLGGIQTIKPSNSPNVPDQTDYTFKTVFGDTLTIHLSIPWRINPLERIRQYNVTVFGRFQKTNAFTGQFNAKWNHHYGSDDYEYILPAFIGSLKQVIQ